MVGAGLFLAGSKTGQAFTQKASDVAADLSDEVARRARDLSDQAEGSASVAKSYASDQFDRMRTTASDASDQVGRAAGAAAATLGTSTRHLQDKAESLASSVAGRAGDLRDRVGDLRDEGVRVAGSAAATVQDITSGATSVASDSAAATTDAGLDAARTARDKAAELTDRAGKTIFQTIEQNPLLVAGVGLLIGGLIASALPRSETEDELLGDASNSAKRRVQAAASEGFDAAKDAVGEIYDETVGQAEAEGLTPDGLSKAAQDVGHRVRRVAETAVTTAFEPNQDTNQVNAHGGKDNG